MSDLEYDKFGIAVGILDRAVQIDQGKVKDQLDLPAILFVNDMLPDDFHNAYHDHELAREIVVREALALKPEGQVYQLFRSLIDTLVATTRYDEKLLAGPMFYGIKK